MTGARARMKQRERSLIFSTSGALLTFVGSRSKLRASTEVEDLVLEFRRFDSDGVEILPPDLDIARISRTSLLCLWRKL